MSKHMRLVVSVLFIVVIFLAIAITRFYSSTSKHTAGRSDQNDIERRLSADAAGNRIFEDSSGLFGVIDSDDRVIVPAEWQELSFAGEGKCIASKRIGGVLLKGCVDYEGNVIVPFIYQSITAREIGSINIYTAESGTDDSVVTYDSSFRPMFHKVWKSCEFVNDNMTLRSNSGTYSYSVDEDGSLALVKAEVKGEVMGCSYSFDVKNISSIEKFDPAMLEYMAAAAGKYLGFAYTGDSAYVSDIRTGGRPVFTKLFPEEKNIISKKLLKIKNMFFYQVDSDDEMPHFAISVSASTEITYSVKDSDEKQTLTDDYRAVIEFSGSSENDLAVVSGSFTESEPTYKTADDKQEKQDSGKLEALLPSPPVSDGE